MNGILMGQLNRRYSRLISDILDNSGYSSGSIYRRREIIKSRWERIRSANENLSFFICGSVAEGIEPLAAHDDVRQGSSLDEIGVVKKIICADEPKLFKDIPDITLLEIERGPDVTPGFAVLKLVRLDCGFMKARIAQSAQRVHETAGLTQDTDHVHDQYLVSSQLFRRSFRPNSLELHGIGTYIRSLEYTSMDASLGFQCFCPEILRKWKLRHRFDWPSYETIQKVSASEGILVPLGARDSASRDVEWRISFSKAERILLTTLNTAFLKVYILLRMLFKGERGISQYQLKTAVFWVAEKTPTAFVDDGFLLTHVKRALLFLNMCLVTCYMPNYFNPSWNILPTNGTTQRSREVISLIESLIAEGMTALFRVDVISRGLLKLYTQPRTKKNRSDVIADI